MEHARRLESQSAAEINNAYFGDGLAKCNPFGLDSIEEMRTACINAAGRFLEQTSIDRATKISNPEVKEETVSCSPCTDIQLAILEDAPEKIKSYQATLDDSCLWFAVRHGKINSVRCLLELGVSPEALDDNKNTMLHIAAVNRDLDLFDLISQQAPHLHDQKNLQGLSVNDIFMYRPDDRIGIGSAFNYGHFYAGSAFFVEKPVAEERKADINVCFTPNPPAGYPHD